MAEATTDGKYVAGQIVPWMFSPGLVAASFFASLIGTLLTVELLHRKKLGKSWESRFQLLSCAVSMGLVGIWCMHFIGNRSIILGDGRPNIQMTYDSGFTILSCILPVIGLKLSFYLAELRILTTCLRAVKDVVSGFFAGISIVAMHYCGNLGASNYTLIYTDRFILAACVIAVGDCIVALMLFFYLKQRWINVFWKRIVCAVILTIAVCGMHYTASIGCSYRLKHIGVGGGNRNTAVIVAGVLCGAAALACLLILFYSNVRNHQLREKAQHVNIACAYFDQEGNVLVTNEGLLPTQVVTQRFSLRYLGDEFSTSHPIFHWIWKVSNDWQSVAGLIPRMRSHFQGSRSSYSYIGGIFSFDEPPVMESGVDETVLFREGFCIAAADLADRLGITLSDLGPLYDRVTGTGMTPITALQKQLLRQDALWLAANAPTLERGQILFFTRILSRSEIDHFNASGLCMAPRFRVDTIITKTMQFPFDTSETLMNSLYKYAEDLVAPGTAKHGTYLTCFAALGRVCPRTFDIAVTKAQQSRLPDVELADGHLNQTQINFLRQYDGFPIGDFIVSLKYKQAREQPTQHELQGFVLRLINALSGLSDDVAEPWFNQLIFNASPVISYYGQNRSEGTAMIFGLTLLLDIHSSPIQHPDRLVFVSLDFFRIRSSFYPGCSDVAKFRSSVHAEFATQFNRESQAFDPSMIAPMSPWRHSSLLAKVHMAMSKRTRPSNIDGSVSERGLVRVPFMTRASSSMGQRDDLALGGILATTDTLMEERMNSALSTHVNGMTGKVTATARASICDRDVKTFADLLYDLARAKAASQKNPFNG